MGAFSGKSLKFAPEVPSTIAFRLRRAQTGRMSTSTNTTGMTFWKVLGVIAVVLIALAVLGPLLEGLFWIALIALALYGGYMLFRSNKKGTPPTTY